MLPIFVGLLRIYDGCRYLANGCRIAADFCCIAADVRRMPIAVGLRPNCCRIAAELLPIFVGLLPIYDGCRYLSDCFLLAAHLLSRAADFSPLLTPVTKMIEYCPVLAVFLPNLGGSPSTYYRFRYLIVAYKQPKPTNKRKNITTQSTMRRT